ncbi:MAG: 5-oxoprolinase/urea amidolyase family protein [Acidimicrobiales bacterium]|nr:5-oxoprolinase/urea amidolyase family protein [Acidimicrobiales bacterium]
MPRADRPARPRAWRVLPMGERALLVEVSDPDDVHRLWSSLRSVSSPAVEEVVAGAATVLVVARPGSDLVALERAVVHSPIGESGPDRSREVVIPVQYDGPDLAAVAALTGLGVDDVVARHSSRRYEVGFVGFSPGFAYLTGSDPSLRVARRDTPRPVVPAGSVALAGEMTAVYPQATPGGWQIIGHTDMAMFDPSRPEPSLLAPGDRVRFDARTGLGRPSDRLAAPARPPTDVGVRVLESGPLSTVQDRGRSGWAHAGVPRAGALDAAAAAYANRLVGNPGASALIEATLGGLRVMLGTGRRLAVTGGRAEVVIDGLPGRQDAALPLPAGCHVAIGPVTAGARAYLAIEGGIDVPPVLGSRSADTLSGLGPAPLRDGDLLPLGPARAGGHRPPPRPFRAGYPRPGDIIEVRARPGPRADWMSRSGFDVLVSSEFVVDSASDRTGLRLRGPVVARQLLGELPSEGMIPGAVQVPPDGQPVVLLRNHPTTGGYPVAVVVDEAGVDALAQAPPGVKVRLRLS